MERVEAFNINVLSGIGTLLFFPFWGGYIGAKHIYMKLSGKVFYSVNGRYITKEELKDIEAKKIHEEKIEARIIPLPKEGHMLPDKTDKFYFFKKRKLYLPYDKLVYVESSRQEKIHQFFIDNADWINEWQLWSGLNIIKIEEENIKEGMFYPQDFSIFKHGFLWRTPMISLDKESGLYGNVHRYFELDPESSIPLKEQMNRLMYEIYEIIDFA